MPTSRQSSPLVAVTATTTDIAGRSRVRLNEAYVTAIERAGLVPLVVPPLAARHAAAVLDGVAGLVLTGGEDVHPRRYGAPLHPTEQVHEGRDESELALVAAARERALPTLAICRGLQVLNVALGGSLVQDLPSMRPGAVDHGQAARRAERVHPVTVEGSSLLARALGATTLDVNSSHHQAIDRLATSLRATAHAPDGVVEGAEGIDAAWWVMGVQWHPEELVATPEPWDRGLFAGFARAMRKLT